MESMMIQATGLTHFYGPNPAIEDVNFGVKRGEILGFLGPNGAGKTTTMRILTGFMPPTRGKVTLDGYDVVEQSLDVRRRVGYLPETVPLYTDMTVTSYLKYMGTLRGMASRDIKRRIEDVIQVCRLEDYRSSLIAKLSKGFRQRVGIAQAILHEPEVLVLDEPTIGIDPIQVVETRSLIKDLGRQQTVVLSSHILPEVSMICERVLIIHEGHIVAEDTPATWLRGCKARTSWKSRLVVLPMKFWPNCGRLRAWHASGIAPLPTGRYTRCGSSKGRTFEMKSPAPSSPEAGAC